MTSFNDFEEVMPAPTYESDVRMAWSHASIPEAVAMETAYGSGRAWRIDIDKVVKHIGSADSHAMIAWWIIEAPWAHPIWHSYSMTLAHLRRFAVIHVPGATHEMLLCALDPKGDRAKLLELGYGHKESCLPLLPANFGAQLVEATDDEAIQKCEDAVKDVCDGKLNPDTDFIKQWIARFGGGMVRK